MQILNQNQNSSLNEEYITLGAHLNHVGIRNGNIINGADDNASGSIGVIEIAEEIAQKDRKRPVLFLLYTAEEMGLIGSEYFVLNPPVPCSYRILKLLAASFFAITDMKTINMSVCYSD